jgi:hypothetical protein
VQPQTLATPLPPHVLGGMQVPQLCTPPHPSGMLPQFAPRDAQVVVGVQLQTLATPLPPHVSGKVQAPHTSVPPHPSGMVPQFLP